MLGGHQLLFTLPLAPNMAPGFCLRHDVDGLVWQPMGDELEGSWGCQHIATLQALGYIQASKEQRKFTLSPPSEFAFQHICLFLTNTDSFQTCLMLPFVMHTTTSSSTDNLEGHPTEWRWSTDRQVAKWEQLLVNKFSIWIVAKNAWELWPQIHSFSF